MFMDAPNKEIPFGSGVLEPGAQRRRGARARSSRSNPSSTIADASSHDNRRTAYGLPTRARSNRGRHLDRRFGTMLASISKWVSYLRPVGGRRADLPSRGAKWRRLGVELPNAEIAATVDYANRKPRRFSADRLGKQLKLTEDERTILGITTIGSHNVPRAERKRIRKALDAERKRKRRRAKGMKPRAVYLENALSRTKPWEAEGICRRTWERRQKRRPEHSRMPPEKGRDASVSAAPYYVMPGDRLASYHSRHTVKHVSKRPPRGKLLAMSRISLSACPVG